MPLVLSRKVGDCIVIGEKIVIKVMRIDREAVKVAIQAPEDVVVDRGEIHDKKVMEQRAKLNAEKLKRL